MNNSIKSLIIDSSSDIITAMKLMDEIKCKLLIITSESKYVGLLSIGDIQRALIKNHKLTDKVSSIMRNDYIVAKPNESIEEVKKLMLTLRAEFMPVVDNNNNLVNVNFWEDLFGEIKKEPLFRFNLPVVIMAGGLGTRLKPLTNVLPKPLIPINDKTFLEEIFERFNNHGCDAFYISVNYKAELIEYYLKQQNLPYSIHYFKEDKPMGTAGSLSLLKGKITETFFVSNCDILINQDYSEVLKYHRENNNEITIVAALKNIPIIYGTLETGENGKLLKLIEKPELNLKINSGMYILEPHLLAEIPSNEFFHITQLIENVNSRGGRVGVFPVSEKSWKDVGNWEEYFKILNEDS
ncbi:MAG: nucleotidyltransferase family protein [Bacteroidetes bacterium]|nr:nucleotidyltransferase family protein [Bacteroidota bacterium]